MVRIVDRTPIWRSESAHDPTTARENSGRILAAFGGAFVACSRLGNGAPPAEDVKPGEKLGVWAVCTRASWEAWLIQVAVASLGVMGARWVTRFQSVEDLLAGDLAPGVARWAAIRRRWRSTPGFGTCGRAGWGCETLRDMELSVRPLVEEQWSAARALLHRSFVNEPFTVQMYGQPLLGRWGGSWDLYSSVRGEESTIALGAHAGEVLVGVVMGSTPGNCRLCRVLAPEPRPEDHHLAIDWQFHQNVAQVHRLLETHAWVEKAAVEPALHGLGIGRRLLESVAVVLETEEPAELVLECAPDRVSFYTSLGYKMTTSIDDPAGPDAFLMQRRMS